MPSVGFAGTADRSGGATRCNAVQRLLLLGAQPRNARSGQFRSLGAEPRGNVVCDARDLGVGVRVTEGRHIISVVGGMPLRAPNDDRATLFAVGSLTARVPVSVANGLTGLMPVQPWQPAQAPA